jgi:hypothetical protein
MTDHVPPVGPAQVDVDQWLREPYGRALAGFVPCLVVMLVGLVVLDGVRVALFHA